MLVNWFIQYFYLFYKLQHVYLYDLRIKHTLDSPPNSNLVLLINFAIWIPKEISLDAGQL